MGDNFDQYRNVAHNSTYEDLKNTIRRMRAFEIYKDRISKGDSSEIDLQFFVMFEGRDSFDFLMMLHHVAMREIFKKLHEDFMEEFQKESKSNVADLS